MRKWVGAALFANGLLDIVGILVRGTFVTPSAANAASFVHWASSTRYVPAYIVVIVGTAIGTAGFFGLATVVRGTVATVGATLAGIGNAFVMALLGVLLTFHGFSGVSGAGAAEAAAASVFNGAVAHTLEALTALNIMGSVLLAVAIWRSGTLVRWVGVPLVVAPVLLAFPFSLGSEVTGAALLAVVGAVVVAPSRLAVAVSAAPPSVASS